MSKKKKSKQQKIITELHRKLQQPSSYQPVSVQSSEELQPSHQYSYQASKSVRVTPHISMAPTTTHVVHDLTKTLLLTTGIIAAQFSLYFFVTHHIIAIPGISY